MNVLKMVQSRTMKNLKQECVLSGLNASAIKVASPKSSNSYLNSKFEVVEIPAFSNFGKNFSEREHSREEASITEFIAPLQSAKMVSSISKKLRDEKNETVKRNVSKNEVDANDLCISCVSDMGSGKQALELVTTTHFSASCYYISKTDEEKFVDMIEPVHSNNSIIDRVELNSTDIKAKVFEIDGNARTSEKLEGTVGESHQKSSLVEINEPQLNKMSSESVTTTDLTDQLCRSDTKDVSFERGMSLFIIYEQE